MALAPGQIGSTSCRLNQGRLDAFRLNAILGPPTAPYNPDPVHGYNGGPYTIRWQAESANRYDVYFGTSGTPPLVSANQTSTSYPLPPLTSGTAYFWRIVAKNDFGSTSGPTWTINAQAPAAPLNPSPAHGATGIANSPTVGWTAASEPGITYNVFLGPGGMAPPQVIGGWTSTSIPIAPPLANNQLYWWRVEAVTNAGVTSSIMWSFTTWPLGTPTNLTPPNGAVDVTTTPTFSWTAATNATSYDLYLGPSSSPPLFVSGLTTTSYTPPASLGSDTVYYWRIVARNSGGTTPGAIWSFTTTDPTKLIIRIDGVAPSMRLAGLTIHDLLNDQPNTCTFTVDTTPPHVGQVIQIGLGSVETEDLIFAGTIDQVDAVYEGLVQHRAWQVTGIDWWRRFNRYKVLRLYPEQSASTIVQDLIATYAPGFTAAHVVAGLPTVTGGIDFTHEDLGACLTRLMQRVGGYWYVDYGQDVHAYLTEATDAPDPLVVGSPTLMHDPIATQRTDLSQTRTRVIVTGGGSQTITDVPAGATTIPIEDGSWFRPDGAGVALWSTITIPHTGVVTGGGGSTVQGLAGPTDGAGTPTAALANTVGGVVGTTDYRVSFKAGGGETVPGPASNSVTGVPVAAPSSPPVVTLAAGLGLLVGAYGYRIAFLTARGETLPGPIGSRTAAALPAPGALAVGSAGLGPLIGAYGYRVTFVTALGETTGGTVASRTAAAMSAPAMPTVDVSLTSHLNGPLKGDYRWRIGFVTALGETLGTPTGIASVAGVTAQPPVLSGDGTGNKIDIKVAWVSKWGESAASSATMDPNHGNPVVITPSGIPSDCTGWIAFSTGSYTSASSPGIFFRMPDHYVGTGSGNLGAGPGVVTDAAGTMGRKASLGIATGPAGVVARRIYRTKAGGSDYFLVAELPNNTTTLYTDTVPDDALTVPAPMQNLNGEAHALSSIPTGPAGTLARRLYRTKAGGSQYFRIGELADNTTTTLADAVPDAALTTGMPVVQTAGGEQHAVTLPTGPPGTMARRLYRTLAGGSEYKLLADVQDNTTPTYVDNVPDTGLGGSSPVLVGTAGASAVQVTAIPIGGPGITARRLYRRDSATLYRFVAEIADNSTSTYLDDRPESDLGDVAPTVGTIGALPGATSVLLASTSAFRSAGGWFSSGSQVASYTGISGNTLTGIPASGPGSLVAALKAGDEVIAAAMLTGTTLSAALAHGESVQVLETVNDTAAQAALAALEGAGSPGIYEHTLSDSRLAWREAAAHGAADLKRFSKPVVTMRYASRDRKTATGKTIHVDLVPLAFTGDFIIQSVTIDQIGVSKGLYPRYTVEASSVRWTFEDVLRQLLLTP